MHILYYITSHGYGHAVRSVAICEALGKIAPELRITIKSGVPQNFFAEELSVSHTVINGVFDIGCLQDDAVSIRIPETLAAYADIAARNRELLPDEAAWCKDNRVDCIVSDIVPFAFEVAEKSRIPSVAISNFTWHDIYAPYIKIFPNHKPMLDDIARLYQKASRVLALDPSMPMPAFDGCEKIKIPAVGKNGNNIKREIYNKFNIDGNKRLGLIYVGNFGLKNTRFELLAQIDGWEFAGIYPVGNAPKNYHYITKDMFNYQDLHASADAIICKLGYGVFAAAMLYGVPLIYLPREDFAEYETLDAEVKRVDIGVTIDYNNFLNVSWNDALNWAGAKKIRPIKNVGADRCAEKIVSLIS